MSNSTKTCPNCGKEINSVAAFCPHCGTPQGTADNSQPKQPAADKAQTSQPKQPAAKSQLPQLSAAKEAFSRQTSSLPGGINPKLVLIAAAAILLLLILIPKKKTINTDDYITVTLTGADGYGKAHLSFNAPQMVEDMSKKKKLSDSDKSDILLLLSNNASSFTLSEAENLSNGDRIKVESSLDKDLLKDYGFKIKNASSKTKVEGLQEAVEIDLADYLTVTFSGTLPDVVAERTVDENFDGLDLTNLRSLSGSDSITAENGDVYEGTIIYNEEGLLSRGYVVINDHYSYTIEGLPDSRFTLESMEQENIQAISDNLKTYMGTGVISSFESMYTDISGVDWSKLAYVPAKAVFTKLDRDYSNNVLYLIYNAVVPVRGLDNQLRAQEFCIIAVNSFVKLDEENTITSQNSWSLSSFPSMADADEYINKSINEYYGNADNATIVSAKDTSLPEISLGESGEEVSGEEVILPTVVEVPEDIAAQAVASTTYMGHTYLFFETPKTWQKAQEFCEKAGGHLATITSAQECAAVEKAFHDNYYGEDDSHRDDDPLTFNTFWLGAQDTTEKSDWAWITGEPFEWNCWGSGEPYEEEEFFLALQNDWGSFKFIDVDANREETGFILEYDPVGWTADNGEVFFSTLVPEGQNPEYEDWFKKDLTDPYGNEYHYSVILGENTSNLVYNLNGEWSELSGTITSSADANGDTPQDLIIWGDNKVLFSMYNHQKTDPARSFRIDLTGVQTLQFESCSPNNWEELYLNDALITRAEAPVRGTKSVTLQNVTAVCQQYVETFERRLSKDSFGRYVQNCTTLSTESLDGIAIYALNGKYSTLRGELMAGLGKHNTNILARPVSVKILADNEVIYEKENLLLTDGIQEISLDVSGKNLLEIQTSALTDENGNSLDTSLYLVNTFLDVSEDAVSEETLAEEAPTNGTRLSELYVVDSRSYDCDNAETSYYDDETYPDLYGYEHDEKITLERDGKVVYNLDKKYDTFRGYLTYDQNIHTDVFFHVEILADDEVVFEVDDLSIRSGRIPFEVSVKDASLLTIQVSGDEWGGVAFTEAVLTK